jgi:chorismate--pyruvate lyase
VGLKKGFEVQPVVQGKVLLKRRSNLPLINQEDGPWCSRMRRRLVRLKVNNTPVVLAQTVVKIDGFANDWRFWKGLGKSSLGSVLFSDPKVKRSELYFARLPYGHAWVQQLLTPQIQADMNKSPFSRVWYARCAKFSRQPNRTPLWVMEVFLPQLEHYIEDSE